MQIQWSADGVSWTWMADVPASGVRMAYVPAAAVQIRAIGVGAGGTLVAVVDPGFLSTLSQGQIALTQALVSPDGIVFNDTTAAAANAALIYARLLNVGRCVISGLVYASTIKLPSGSTLEVTGTLRRADNLSMPLLISEFNAYSVAATAVNRSSGVVTVNAGNAPWVVGQQLFVANGQNNRAGSLVPAFFGVNGTGYIATLASVGAANFTYAQAGANAACSASAQDFVAFIPVKKTIASASITVSGTVATVAEAAHGRTPGQVLYLGSGDNLVAGLAGIIEIASCPNLNTWTYTTAAGANPTAATTFIVNEDHDIIIKGSGYIDGNRPNNTALPAGSWWNRIRALSIFGMINGLTIDCAMGSTVQQIAQINVSTGVEIHTLPRSGDTQVAWQFEGGSKRNLVYGRGGNSVGTDPVYPGDDFCSLLFTDWSISSTYNSTICPYGLWPYHVGFTMRNCRITDGLNLLKIAGSPGQLFDDILIDGVGNSVTSSQSGNMVWFHDDGLGFAGVNVGTLKVVNANWTTVPGSSSNAIRIETLGTIKNLVVQGLNASGVVAVAIRMVTGTVENMRLSEVEWRTSASLPTQRLLGLEGGTIKNLTLRDSDIMTGNGATGGLAFNFGAAVLGTLTIDNTTVDGLSANAGYLGNLGAGAIINHKNVRTGTNGLANLYYINTAGSVHDLRFEGCDLNLNYGFNDNAQSSSGNKFSVTSGKFTINASFNVVQVGGAAQWDVSVGPGAVVSGGGWIRTNASATYSLFGGKNLGADLSKSPASILRTPGSTFFATVGAGTILANNQVICDATNAANSWKQVSNSALVY